ncbi:MAG TPA: hypothetical protein VFB50_22440 [Chloroflexota bacterium]|nr:hypothetical protein [Chloroflexota bacterium]
MSVRPVVFNADGSIEVVFDEMGHSGTIPAAQIVWSKNIDGTDNHNYLVLDCPDGCGASATHPVGGGAAPPEVQQLFVRKATHAGCACGQVAAGEDVLAEAHAQLNCNRMDGPGRWQVNPQVFGREAPQQRPGQAPILQVVYVDPGDGLIVGIDPSGGVGAAHKVAVLDVAEYEVLVRTEPAYLSADGNHVSSTPRSST